MNVVHDSNDFGRSLLISRWFLLSGIIAPPLLVFFVILASVLNPGYSNITETVSQLGVHGRPHPVIINTGFVLYGLLITGLAFGLYKRFVGDTAAKLVWFTFAIHGISFILLGLFQADPDSLESAVTPEGIMHHVFTQLGFWSLTVGILVFGGAVRLKPYWRGFLYLSIAVAVFNLTSGLVFRFEFSQAIEGLLQRSIYAVPLTWIEIVAIRSLILNTRQLPGAPNTY
jgi:hypothetical membrane protein